MRNALLRFFLFLSFIGSHLISFGQQELEPYPLKSTFDREIVSFDYGPTETTNLFSEYSFLPNHLPDIMVRYHVDSVQNEQYFYTKTDTAFYKYDSGGTYVKIVDSSYSDAFKIVNHKILARRSYFRDSLMYSEIYRFDSNGRSVFLQHDLPKYKYVLSPYEVDFQSPYRITMEYDSMGRTKRLEVLNPDSSNGNWETVFRFDSLFDRNNRDSLFLGYKKTSTGLTVFRRVVFINDTLGRTFIKQYFDSALNKVDTFYYDSDRVTLIKHYVIRSANWELDSKESFTYYPNGVINKHDLGYTTYYYDSSGLYLGYDGLWGYCSVHYENHRIKNIFNRYKFGPGDTYFSEDKTYYYIGEPRLNLVFKTLEYKPISFYPNPAVSTIRMAINRKSPVPITVTLYDMQGKLVRSQVYSLIAGKNYLSFDVSNVSPPGMYLINAVGDDFNQTSLIMKN